MKRAVPVAAALFLVAVLTCVPKAHAGNPHFTTIDFPGAGLTVANGVNQNGEIVGFYRMALQSGGLGPIRGFLLSNGQFTTIHVPGVARTRAFGINNAGPTLIAVGRHDWICPVDQAEEIHRLVPSSTLAVFETSGHSPQVEERDAFVRRLGALQALGG